MKINFTGQSSVSALDIRRNLAHSAALGFPKLGKAGRPRLAVVGGGPSVLSHVDTLRQWDGDIWAINGTYHWLETFGIESRFFCIDPHPNVAPDITGAKRALLATHCDTHVFDLVKDADTWAVKLGEGHFINGPTTSCSAPHIAAEMGYREVTFFGCEGNYTHITHVYSGAIVQTSYLKLVCNGEEFITVPGMLMQAKFLSELIRAVPSFLKEKSGGLLRAMIADPEYDVIAATADIHEQVRAA